MLVLVCIIESLNSKAGLKLNVVHLVKSTPLSYDGLPVSGGCQSFAVTTM
ncbi:hypothetical protein BofuT4_uP068390.1 [Botrytis cinerea T4]|uniref:Uncharacterized protein n=1 Tax=Botryotinia fuckeliana (strain T4) TaxID=999810 RepID=G2XQT6_BOTF4|nr:hypothetical protein BofuT4_uP068390.1 [Botrytis cinerea T4]